MCVMQEVSEDEVVLMWPFFLQEVTLADLSMLPYGSLIFEGLDLGGFDKRPNLQR